MCSKRSAQPAVWPAIACLSANRTELFVDNQISIAPEWEYGISKVIQSAFVELTAIAGQQPVITRARKSISNFKLREGMEIGVKVTLRRQRMFEFMDRLVNIALPRVRDFRGVSPKSFDQRSIFF